MVKEWGMSEKVGFRTIEQSSSSLVVVNDLSPHTTEQIDSEIKRILQVFPVIVTFLLNLTSRTFPSRNLTKEQRQFSKNTAKNTSSWLRLC